MGQAVLIAGLALYVPMSMVYVLHGGAKKRGEGNRGRHK